MHSRITPDQWLMTSKYFGRLELDLSFGWLSSANGKKHNFFLKLLQKTFLMHEVKFSISTCFERSKYGIISRKLRYVKQKKEQEKLTLILTPCVVACVPRFHILFGSFFTSFERGWLYNFLLNVLRTV